MIQKDPQIHHRRSIRLAGFDYTQPGAYFVTICTYQRGEIFGAIVGNTMQLSPLGIIVKSEWFRSVRIRKEIRLFKDEFVVMPNHLHGIVWILGADGVRPEGVRPDGVRLVRKKGARLAPLHTPLHRIARSLGSFVAGFKAAVTSRAWRELNSSKIWQRNYYEHIIRKESEFWNIWNYIDTNPLRWQEDQLHPSAPHDLFNQAIP